MVVGRIGRSMVRQHRFMPGRIETMMAVQVENTHLSRKEAAVDSSGNLYAPSPDPDNAAVTGGWSGKRRTAQRAFAGAALLGAGGVALLPGGRKAISDLWCSARS